MFRTLQTVEPRSASEQAAYGKWLDQRSDREDARADRSHGAEGVIPTPLWIVLLPERRDHLRLHALLRRQRRARVVQATMMGSVAVVITSTLLLLWFLDNPYHRGVSGLRPTAMERTLELLEHETAIAGGSSRFLAAAGNRAPPRPP